MTAIANMQAHRDTPIVRPALAQWWSDWLLYTVLSLVWLVGSLPLITFPPMTAALFGVIHRHTTTGSWEAADFVGSLRRVAWPAWKAAAAASVLVLVVVANLIIYSTSTGIQWTVLRGIWVTVGIGVGIVGLVFWPHWFRQEDKRLAPTLANSLRFFVIAPPGRVAVVIGAAAAIMVSTLMVVPVLVGVIPLWLTVVDIAVGHTVTQDLQTHQPKPGSTK